MLWAHRAKIENHFSVSPIDDIEKYYMPVINRLNTKAPVMLLGLI